MIMNYKALEDLVNILVKKSGTDLSEDIVSHEIQRLEEKKKKLNKEKEKLEEKLGSYDYSLQMEKDKDLNEKSYLEKYIKSLIEEKEQYVIELNGFNKILESGETYLNSILHEIKDLKIKIKKLKVKIDMEMDDNGENRSEYLSLLETLNLKEKEINRNKIVLEELDRIEDEIKENEYKLDNLKLKIEKINYSDYLTLAKDNLIKNNLENEINLVNESIEIWQKSPLVLGANILDSFKSGKDIDDIRKDVEELVTIANKELKCTQEEINGSNIFEIMDNYDKLLSAVKTKVSDNKYVDEEATETITVKSNYHREKISKYKDSLESINSRKIEVLNLISVSKNLSEDVKQNRLKNEKRLMELETMLFSLDTTKIASEEIKNIDKLIGEIKNDIDNDKYLENEYVDDIYGLKEELKNLDINYATIQNEITKEEKILEILDNRVNSNNICENRIQKLTDKILSIEYINRIDSLKNQQQYLYVDAKVIRDEIYNLWKRTTNSDREEVVVEKKPLEEVKVQEIEPEIEVVQELLDESEESEEETIEIIDDFDFEELD